MGLGMRNQKRFKKQDDIQWGGSLVTTVIMILLIVAVSFWATRTISRMEEERSLERLYEETGSLADNIEMYMNNDGEELEMLSAVITHYEDPSSPELWNLLDSHTNVGLMSRIELLLPGDIVLTSGGKPVDASGLISFEEEAAKGIHISDRELDILHQDTYIVRHYVPVNRDGKTIAMLYGVVVLGELPETASLSPYGGNGALYIIDGKTGDFLADTWHNGELGNTQFLGDRKSAPGSLSPDQIKQMLSSGESRYVVYASETAGEYLYFYYEPMAINDWRIAMSVPESVVFESANAIKRVLKQFLAFELACFVVYFLWMTGHVRRMTAEKQRRLDTINHIYDVERLLFNAHEKKENVYAALEKLGSILSAGMVSFWILDADGGNEWFFWEKGRPAEERRENSGLESAGKLLEFFSDGNEMYGSDSERELRNIFPEKEFPDLYNVTAVPVEDMSGHICGILAVCNAKRSHEQAALLKNMQFSFGMFCKNLKSYMEIQEQGDRDALTGLYNRNRYERDLPAIYAEHRASLACVYIDVNGLHEKNNTEGHDTGDRMLCAVASGIQEHFRTEYLYRTGGDEFILFLPDADEADIEAQSEDLISVLTESDYHISVGFQCETDISSISLLIKRAEQKMYAEKKKYYEKHDRRSSRN